MNTAQILKIINATPVRARALSTSEWLDSGADVPFAYSFEDGSSAIYLPCGGILACSTRALERWCGNSRIDRLINE